MKNIVIIFSLLGLVLIVKTTIAVQNSATGQQGQKLVASPTGTQVQNQNQIETQNQGEDSQLQINNQEQESMEDSQGEGLEARNQNAIENMSIVAKKVQELLQIRTTGGIGEQVRQVAREQNQAQTQIEEQLNRLDSKGSLARLLTGTDYNAVKNLKAQIVQNQARIKQLEQLQNQLFNQGDITMVQETIQALIEENFSLQEKIVIEEQTKSLLGWLFRILAN